MTPDIDDVEHAIWRAARNAKNGIAACAEHMGVKRGDLSGRLGRSDLTRRPRVDDLIGVMEHTQDLTPLEILCEMFGGAFATRGHSESASLLHAVLHAVGEGGDLIKVYEECDKDKVWTHDEKVRMRREIADVRRALAGIEDKLNEMPTE